MDKLQRWFWSAVYWTLLWAGRVLIGLAFIGIIAMSVLMFYMLWVDASPFLLVLAGWTVIFLLVWLFKVADEKRKSYQKVSFLGV